ncbi:MAG TPA: hypothetical protein VK658_03630 [Chryseolinea sp.]|nr:hypothetical protein [Chryseolinea sp.]
MPVTISEIIAAYLGQIVGLLIEDGFKVERRYQASVFKLFREHKKAIKIHIDDHDVDFEKKEHLMNLLVYCNGLK